MKTALKLTSIVGLALVIVPPILYLAGNLDKGLMQSLMLAGTVLWFASAPWWMGRNNSQ